MQKNYYEILNISKDATPQEIKKAYRKKALEFHPDKNPDDLNAEEEFKKIGEAYEVLSSSIKKERYDQGTPIEDILEEDTSYADYREQFKHGAFSSIKDYEEFLKKEGFTDGFYSEATPPRGGNVVFHDLTGAFSDEDLQNIEDAQYDVNTDAVWEENIKNITYASLQKSNHNFLNIVDDYEDILEQRNKKLLEIIRLRPNLAGTAFLNAIHAEFREGNTPLFKAVLDLGAEQIKKEDFEEFLEDVILNYDDFTDENFVTINNMIEKICAKRPDFIPNNKQGFGRPPNICIPS